MKAKEKSNQFKQVEVHFECVKPAPRNQKVEALENIDLLENEDEADKICLANYLPKEF